MKDKGKVGRGDSNVIRRGKGTLTYSYRVAYVYVTPASKARTREQLRASTVSVRAPRRKEGRGRGGALNQLWPLLCGGERLPGAFCGGGGRRRRYGVVKKGGGKRRVTHVAFWKGGSMMCSVGAECQFQTHHTLPCIHPVLLT